ncbi:hypothetical protein OPS25_06225 [Alteromonas ponticola]|uniref:DUF2127 domain-containing protein n=1 Tax=Alteromonas aquimaris TaxID=2998417 RepID=A0ABT3P5N7_9ALTE|nr:hypothetical protein [Alteromonas aquimaris]MCW8108086.1 hypothetical protein [Alteromonas aquimaris]
MAHFRGLHSYITSLTHLVGWLIILYFVLFGIVRVGVGAALFLQSQTLIDLVPLQDALLETQSFINARLNEQLVVFTLPIYFLYIFLMGGILLTGAYGVIKRKPFGFYCLFLYLTMHAGLFLNFQEINPKLTGLAVAAAAWVVLYVVRKPVKG